MTINHNTMTLRQIVTTLPFNKTIDVKQEIYQILSKFSQVAVYALVAFSLFVSFGKMPINLYDYAQAKTIAPEKVAMMT